MGWLVDCKPVHTLNGSPNTSPLGLKNGFLLAWAGIHFEAHIVCRNEESTWKLQQQHNQVKREERYEIHNEKFEFDTSIHRYP